MRKKALNFARKRHTNNIRLFVFEPVDVLKWNAMSIIMKAIVDTA